MLNRSDTTNVVVLAALVAVASSLLVRVIQDMSGVAEGDIGMYPVPDGYTQYREEGGSDRTPDVPSTLPGRVMELERRIDELGGHAPLPDNLRLVEKMERLREEVNTMAGVVAMLDTQAGQSGTDASTSRPTEQYDEEILASKSLNAFADAEAGFATQVYDPMWATEAEQELQEGLMSYEQETAGNDAGLSRDMLAALECRTRTCRMELTGITDSDVLQDFLIRNTAGIFSSGNMHYGDGGRVVIFLQGNEGV